MYKLNTMFLKTFAITTVTLLFITCASHEVAKDATALNTNQITIREAIGPHIQNTDTIKRVSPQKQKLKDTIKVVYKNSYCGGAAPSEEILKAYNTLYPLKNTTIVLKNSSPKETIELTTDKNGIAIAELKSGKYNYFMTEKYTSNSNISFSSSCKSWLSMSFGQIIISENKTKGYLIQFDYGCNPCEPPRP